MKHWKPLAAVLAGALTYAFLAWTKHSSNQRVGAVTGHIDAYLRRHESTEKSWYVPELESLTECPDLSNDEITRIIVGVDPMWHGYYDPHDLRLVFYKKEVGQ
jgi:hypothetical protein